MLIKNGKMEDKSKKSEKKVVSLHLRNYIDNYRFKPVSRWKKSAHVKNVICLRIKWTK